MNWVQPPVWSIPKEWDHARCFVICSGPSLTAQLPLISKLQGRFIAVKHGVFARPDADVLFLSGEGMADMALPLTAAFKGRHMIVRGRGHPALPDTVKRVTRTKDHTTLCELPTHVCGRDSGTSAINAAYHFGATEIILLGYDMTGGHFCEHPLQDPPQDHFVRHMEHTALMVADAKRKGIRIVNTSPICPLKCFDREPLEAFL